MVTYDGVLPDGSGRGIAWMPVVQVVRGDLAAVRRTMAERAADMTVGDEKMLCPV